MRILIIEPHGDDALLSCHSILDTNNEIHLLTLSARESNGLEKHFKSIKELFYCDAPNMWYPDGKVILKTNSVHRAYEAGEPISNNYTNQLKEIFGLEYSENKSIVRSEIMLTLKENDYDLIVCPISTVHPYHVLVRDAYTSLELGIPTIYYADKYYIQNRYAKEMYEDLKKSMNLDEEYNPGYTRLDEENKRIADILWDVYPSEGQLLRFYSDIILWYPCKYSYKSGNKLIERLIGELNG